MLVWASMLIADIAIRHAQICVSMHDKSGRPRDHLFIMIRLCAWLRLFFDNAIVVTFCSSFLNENSRHEISARPLFATKHRYARLKTFRDEHTPCCQRQLIEQYRRGSWRPINGTRPLRLQGIAVFTLYLSASMMLITSGWLFSAHQYFILSLY